MAVKWSISRKSPEEDHGIEQETFYRLAFFFGMLLCVGLWEWWAPRRQLSVNKALRWRNNLGLVFLNSVVLRWLQPVTAVALAAYLQQQQWGLLNLAVLPLPIALIIGVAVLDMAIYFQHRLFHAVPLLWQLHQVHHADLDIDVTTGLRFHPIEIMLSMLIKYGVILLVGPAALAVLIFEIVLNASAMFNHGNIRLPLGLDRLLRSIIVTPDMHRVHHSVYREEHDTNFGFFLSIWDRLFGSYQAQPRDGHTGMAIGIKHPRDPAHCSQLWHLLAMPFKRRG